MDGRVGSNEPCVAECLRVWPLTSVTGDPWVTDLAFAGLEKLWWPKLAVLEFPCVVNCVYIGVAGDEGCGCGGCRDLGIVMDGRGVSSSPSEVSTRRRAGLEDVESCEGWAEELDKGEKLPGPRG
jgi:hypothetical protein